MKLKNYLILFLLISLSWSCKKEDDDNTTEATPLRTLSEVALEDEAEINEFLETHFYNYEEFDNPPVNFDYLIQIDTIAGDNSDKTSLKNSENMKSEVIFLDSDEWNLDVEEENVPHTLHYLIAQEGIGERPTVVDSTYLKYEGSRLDGDVFDSSVGNPIWFDLQGNLTSANPGVIRGFKNGLPKYNAGGEVIENEDGTFDVTQPGIGMIIMPSGLAYYSGSSPGESYAPLIFKINLITIEEADHDRDGIPTIKEDRDGDNNPNNDDTDEDNFPDYVDTDDDGDGTLTIDEIKDEDGNIVIPYPDTDNDGTPDYLDPDNS